MKEINIAAILENAPKGTKLWFSPSGYVEFYGLGIDNHIVIVNQHNLMSLSYSGRKLLKGKGIGNCLLFPSKENRDWSKFKVSIEHQLFNEFDKVLVRTILRDKNGDKFEFWKPALYHSWNEDLGMHLLYDNSYCTDDSIVPLKKAPIGLSND